MTIEQPFLPVLLGSDMNAYGMARAFYEAYGLKPLVLGRSHLTATQDSSILTFREIDRLNDQEVFVSALTAIAREYNHKKLLLLACGDDYAKLIIKNKPALQEFYTVPYIDESLMDQILLKENFYEMCEKYEFKYPGTSTCTFESYETFEVPFEYPIIIKASNSVEYWACSFPGKKKVFIAHDEAEKTAILS
ncbi:MAG: ATP-grasp domain-containing protein, partial [Lysinibacillus sp.]